MKNFDWNAFGRKNIAVWCKTEEEAKDFCKQSHEHGFDWCGGNSREEETYFGSYRDMCYLRNAYASKEYFIKEGYTVVEWSDYMDKLFTKSDLKDGDFVLRNNGEIEIALPSIGVSVNEKGFSYIEENNNDFDCIYDLGEWDIMEVRRPTKPSECQFRIFEEKWGRVMFKREDPVEMTLEEVCEALGKNIKIVKEKN